MVSDDDGNEIPSGEPSSRSRAERLVWRDRDIDLTVTITFADLGGRTEMKCHVAGETGGAPVRRLVDHVRQAGGVVGPMIEAFLD